MTTYIPSAQLLPRVAQGDIAAIARLLSRADAALPESREALAEVYRRAGNAHITGITGVPGSGKSTLVCMLAKLLRKRGARVGIIAIDPSSPYSGGSIMGDRVRMSELAGDDGIFVRSMATHGATGGLARAALDSADILDIAGYGYILLETVGVGQDEVEIASASHTTIVVSAPGLGDEVQAIKAGILEIADIHVVSKCDRPEANSAISDLKHMLMLGLRMQDEKSWHPPVVATSALNGQGLEELIVQIDRHRNHLGETDAGVERKHRIARFRMQKCAEELLRTRFNTSSAEHVAALAERLANRQLSPYAAGEQLLNAS